MSRKALIYCVAALCVLFLGLIAAVATLYSDEGGGEEISYEILRSRASSAHPVLNAVPSDAALVFSGRNLGRGLGIAADSSYVFGKVLSGDSDSFRTFISMLASRTSGRDLGPARNSPFCISLHFSGKAIPLLCCRAGRNMDDISSAADSLRALASANSVYLAFRQAERSDETQFDGGCILLASPSESLVHSAERHIDSGSSILDNRDFAALASDIQGDYVFYFDHNYSKRLSSCFLSGQYRTAAGFLSGYSSWSGASVDNPDNGNVSLSGASCSTGLASDYANVFTDLKPEPISAFSFLPDCSAWASALSISDFKAYIAAYRRHLDASGGLKDYKYLSTLARRRTGSDPESWADSLGIREVSVAGVPVGDSIVPAIALKVSNPSPELLFQHGAEYRKFDGEILRTDFASFPGLLFGKLFASSDTLAMYSDGWLVFGSAPALGHFKRGAESISLSGFLDRCGSGDILRKDGAAFISYFAMTGDRAVSYFSKGLAASAVKAMSGITFSPVSFSLYPGSGHRFRLDVSRVRSALRDGNIDSMLRDTVIIVPGGPFTVKNCGTGRQNRLSQNKNNYLVLSEMDGKSLWGVPIGEPICGAVAEVDYFNNGKIQFLLAAGDRLILIDRLGRYVRPFPVKLPEKALLGPAVYDTGEGKTVAIIHPGNRVGMYSPEGKPAQWWKGVILDETVKQLPELLSVGDVTYWIMRTSVAAYIVPFEGGKPLSPADGDKRIRPDAEITSVKAGSVTAVCLDGRERTIKLTK